MKTIIKIIFIIAIYLCILNISTIIHGKDENTLSLCSIIGDRYIDCEEKAFFNPAGAAADSKGNIYIIDRGNKRIAKYDPYGEFITAWGEEGDAPGEFRFSYMEDEIICDKDDNVYILTQKDSKVHIFNSNGKYLHSFRTHRRPHTMSVDSKGNIYLGIWVNNSSEKLFYVYDRKGNVLDSFGDNFLPESTYKNFSHRLTVGMLSNSIRHNKKDEMYVAYSYYPIIDKYSADNKLLWRKGIPVGKIKGHSEEDIELFNKYTDPKKIKYQDEREFYAKIFCFNLSVYNDNLFLLLNHYISIIQINSKGNLLKTIFLEKSLLKKMQTDPYWTEFFINKKTSTLFVYPCNDMFLYGFELLPSIK